MNETQTRTGTSWKSVARWAAIAQIVLIALVMVLIMEVIPPLIVFAVLLGVAIWLLGGKERVGVGMIGVVSLLHVAMSIPFVGESLLHPESAGDFITSEATMIAALVGVIAAVAAWRGAQGAAGPRTVARGAIALGVLLAAFSIVSFIGVEDEGAQAGDLELVAEDVEFVPTDLDAEAGEVAVHVDNNDNFRHNFSIDELDVSEELVQGKGTRITFDADPGEYEFYCSVPGHEDMEGTLTVQ